MLIAQLTDTHVGARPDDPAEANLRRLQAALARLAGLDPLPDLLLVTGDLVDDGRDVDSYRRYRAAFAGLPFPVFHLMGNHDARGPFREVFPDAPVAGEGGFVQYGIEDLPLRLLVLDTLEEGRHGGGFCAERAAWLEARLAEAPDRPTLVALHHPPIPTGIDWLTENPDAAWVRRLEGVVARHASIIGLVAGHVHRPMTAVWAGKPLIVCASCAPALALDLSPIDPERPDGRPMIVADPPGLALHLWDGERLTTHFETVDVGAGEGDRVLARYGPGFQPLVRALKAERARNGEGGDSRGSGPAA